MRDPGRRAPRFLPPHLLRALARGGDEARRLAALRTMAFADVLAARREASAAVASRRGAGGGGPGRGVAPRADGPGVAEAREAAGAGLARAAAFFREAFGRRGVAGAGRGWPGVAVVSRGAGYLDAGWDGRCVVLGGDPAQGGPLLGLAGSLEVIGHELGHAVIDAEGGLVGRGQPGALAEAIADAFAAMVAQHAAGQDVRQATWLLGAGLLAPGVCGSAVRSLAAPGSAYDDPLIGRDPQARHMDSYRHLGDGGGGDVHANAGIPAHAFYRTAMALGGASWERAGLIWYETLRDLRLDRHAGFARFARLNLDHAARLFGPRGPEVESARAAWLGVGVAVDVAGAALAAPARA